MTRQIKRRKSSKKTEMTENGIKRRRKFTRRNRKLIYEALRTGLPIGKAMELAGLDRSTYYRWMDKGKDERYPIHMRFRRIVKRIQAELQIEKLNTIRKVAEGGYNLRETIIEFDQMGKIVTKKTIKTIPPCWQAAAWFLERRYPKEYGRKRVSARNTTPEENPEELAAQIKSALDAMMESVPIAPNS